MFIQMTDEQIIKALECCKKAILHQDCLDLKCPYAKEFGCNIDKEQLRNMALELINRQKAEIERLKGSKSTGLEEIESTVSEFWTGLEKLSMYKGKDKPTLEELLEYIEQVKDEAVIEFAKTLNDTSEDCTGKGYPYVLCKDIDRIADDWTGGAFKKLPHSSLCETETYEGNVGGKKNDFRE